MPKTNNTSGKKLTIAQRQLKATQLRKEGFSYREIAERLGISHVQAYNDVKAVLDELRHESMEVARELRDLVTERNNSLITVYYNDAMQGDIKAAEQVRRIHDQLIRLHGADEPARPD